MQGLHCAGVFQCDLNALCATTIWYKSTLANCSKMTGVWFQLKISKTNYLLRLLCPPSESDFLFESLSNTGKGIDCTRPYGHLWPPWLDPTLWRLPILWWRKDAEERESECFKMWKVKWEVDERERERERESEITFERSYPAFLRAADV